MRIVNRKEFLLLPAGTVFSKYEPCAFSELMIKGDTTPYNDYFCVGIVDAVDCHNTEEYVRKLEDSEVNGSSVKMDFDVYTRDGLYEDDQLFAVWEREDVEKLILRLQIALKQAF